MPERHILVVAVDGLRASALGAYGNTAYSTPNFDEFAAESFLFDSCFAPSADLTANYRALWQSIHPLRANDNAAAAPSLPRLLAELGYQSTLVTDDEKLTMLKAAGDFDNCVQVAGTGEGRAADVPQTALARLFSEACTVIEAPHSGTQLVWVHARGMYGPWNAPIELQQMLLDDELTPVDDVGPPDFAIDDADDPDIAFRYGVAYGAQVMVLDACWQAIDDAVRIGRDARWLVMLVGMRGMPLGEHRRVGGVDPRLYVEQLHVPWLVRFPDGGGRLARSSQLVSQLDLLPTLIDWATGGEPMDSNRLDGMSTLPLVEPAFSPWREALFFGSVTGGRAIRTPDWSLRYEPGRGADSGELFVRPDDRWEANDVAGLCPDVVEGLMATAEEIATRIQTGESLPISKLPGGLPTSIE